MKHLILGINCRLEEKGIIYHTYCGKEMGEESEGDLTDNYEEFELAAEECEACPKCLNNKIDELIARS